MYSCAIMQLRIDRRFIMHEHMAMHKEQERDRFHAAGRRRSVDQPYRMESRVGARIRSQVAAMRSLIARTLRRLADSIDSYAGGCVDGQLTCQ
jgi:hypothetical protein